MGKGKSSDIYTFNILRIDEDRRQFQITLKSTGATGEYQLPDYGLETLFLMILYGRLPYSVTHLDAEEVDTEEDKQISELVGSYMNGWIDISKFVYDNVVSLTPDERDKWRRNAFDHWRALSEEQQRPYIEWNNQKKMRIKEKKYELVKKGDYPPLAYELDWDVDFSKVAWKFIQSVRLDSTTRGKKPTGTYTVFVTDPKWMKMIKTGSDGTTAYEQNLQPFCWTLETHHYFPRSFLLLTIQLLMMRLPRHVDNNPQNLIGMVPYPIFLEILSCLAVLSYSDKVPVPEWEIRRVHPSASGKEEQETEAKQTKRPKK